MEPHKQELARLTNKSGRTGGLSEAVGGADVFIGASSPDILGEKEVKSRAHDPIIFALSNPNPEIDPAKAKKWGARVVGTARADLPNQINNVLGFPGTFRGALLVRSRAITEGMKLAAAEALASVVPDSELSDNFVVPQAFDRRTVPAVARAVARAAMETGSARVRKSRAEIEREIRPLRALPRK